VTTAVDPFRSAAFRYLFAGRFVSFLGNAIAPVAIAFAVLDLTGSAGDLGLVLAARSLPMVVFVLVGGVVADRLPRQVVLAAASGLSALTQAIAAALLLTDNATIASLMALEALNGASSAFLFPAIAGITPQTVAPKLLQQANASLRLGQNAAWIGGAAVAGFLVAAVGSGWSLAVDALTYALGALLLSRIRLPPGDRVVAGSTLRDLREGWTEFRARTWVWVIVIQATFVNLAIACGFTTLGPVIADETVSRQVWGLVLAAQAVGMILGGLLALRVRPLRPLRVGVLASALIAPLLAALAFTPQALPLVLCAVAAGVGIEVFSVLWDLSLQQHVPPDRLSRVASYDVLGSFVFIPVGYVLAGPLSDAFGVTATVAGCAIVALTATLLTMCVRDVRDLRRTDVGSSVA
jgi:predicted MFS family arabinose efflux permease